MLLCARLVPLHARGTLQNLRRASTSSSISTPFRSTPQEALRRFEDWHSLNSPFPAPRVDSLRPFYLPFWLFEYSDNGQKVAEFIYGGKEFARYLTHVFKPSPQVGLQPFDASFLHAGPSAVLNSGAHSHEKVTVEPFHLFESTALQTFILKGRALSALSRLTSQRCFLPGYALVYKELGLVEHRCFLSGSGPGVFGLAEENSTSRLWKSVVNVLTPLLSHLGGLSGKISIADILRSAANNPYHARVLTGLLLYFLRSSAAVLLAPPFLVGAFLSISAALTHALFAPSAAHKTILSQWEEDLAKVLEAQRGKTDEWRFRPREGSTRSSQQQSSGQQSAGQRRERRTAPSSGGGGSSSGSRSAFRAMPKVDASDPYAVLGLARGASTEEIQAAFRSQLMTYHPDHAAQSGWNEAEASERTRLIIDAFRKLRDEKKRTKY
jgi:DnaJ-domain-containing protein 1